MLLHALAHAPALADRVRDGSDEEATAIIDELVASGKGQTFGPDTLAEARNRCYKPYKPRAVRA